MKITLLKGSNDKKSFKLFETLGAKVNTIDDLEKTDDKIQELEYENEDLRDELRSQEQIKEDFYTPKSSYEVYGVSPRDFV